MKMKIKKREALTNQVLEEEWRQEYNRTQREWRGGRIHAWMSLDGTMTPCVLHTCAAEELGTNIRGLMKDGWLRVVADNDIILVNNYFMLPNSKQMSVLMNLAFEQHKRSIGYVNRKDAIVRIIWSADDML